MIRSDEVRWRELLLLKLIGRVAARRRPRELPDGSLEWIIGHPYVCPLRLSFRVWAEGGLSLRIYDAATGQQLLPKAGQSISFLPEQQHQLTEILSAVGMSPGWWANGELE